MVDGRDFFPEEGLASARRGRGDVNVRQDYLVGFDAREKGRFDKVQKRRCLLDMI